MFKGNWGLSTIFGGFFRKSPILGVTTQRHLLLLSDDIERLLMGARRIARLMILINIVLVILGGSAASVACTGLKVKAIDGSTVHGRTFEFGVKVQTSIIVIPRGYSFTATTPLGNGISYQAKHVTLGVMCFNNPLVMDGMNERGLSIGTFYFPGFAGYTATTIDNRAKSLSPIDFSNWILTQFATLNEVRAALKDVVIAPVVIKEWGTTPPPFHYLVYDKTGNSIVIEPVNGRLKVYDNPLGTLTKFPLL